jgi:hypothetical protein
MNSRHNLDSVEWTPRSACKGPDARYQGQEVFYPKVLGDRARSRGSRRGRILWDLACSGSPKI